MTTTIYVVFTRRSDGRAYVEARAGSYDQAAMLARKCGGSVMAEHDFAKTYKRDEGRYDS